MTEIIVVTTLAYVLAGTVVLAAVVPLSMIGERHSFGRVATWIGWLAVVVVAAALAKYV